MQLDRKNTCRYVPGLNLPMRDDTTKLQHDTVLDGELVIDREEDNQVGARCWSGGRAARAAPGCCCVLQVRIRYLAYDLMAFNGTIFTHRSFDTRLGVNLSGNTPPPRTRR